MEKDSIPHDLVRLVDAHERAQQKTVWIQVGSAVVALICLVLGLLIDDAGPAPWVFAGVGALVTVALWFVRQNELKAAHRIIEVLMKDPARVVWTYAGTTENRVNGVRTGVHSWVQVCLSDGQTIRLHVPREEDDGLVQVVADRASSAQVGYSVEWAQRYLADPASFR